MKNKYTSKYLQLAGLLFLLSIVASCKKNNPAPNTTTTTTVATPSTFGLYEYSDGTNYRIFIPLTKIGTQTVNDDLVFDTGSAGLALDASGTIPDSLITANGFKFTGDSILVNGITITSKKSVMEYGDATEGTNVYGNIAYANITISNQTNNGLTIKRVPFFLYYKVLDITKGDSTKLAAHSADIFGVSPEYSYASTLIKSPLSYYTPGTGLTNGFKLAKLVKADFTSGGVYEQNILTLGLTKADLNSSGFIMHDYSSSYTTQDGYSPDIPGTITYSGNTIAANFLFDSGTPEITIIEDKTAQSLGILPAGSVVTLKTKEGFTYTYTTTKTTNVTQVQNPSNTHDYRTIFSLEFFIDNEFLTDYADHEIGLKNN